MARRNGTKTCFQRCQTMLISAPSSPRELCDLFLLYRESAGLDALLDCIDFSAASPWQLYYSVFGTNPKSTNDVIRTPGYSARLAFMSMLSEIGRASCRERV